MTACRPLALAAVLLCAAPAAGQAGPRLELALVDAPYGTSLGRAPSMQQALQLSSGAYRLAHWGLAQLEGERPPLWRRLLAWTATLAFDFVANWLPFGDVWTHEEFHRAALGRRGIDSYDGVYDFALFASSTSVYRVRDADLVALKRDHPAEQVRMAAAGLEGEVELVKAMERADLFEDARGTHFALYWLSLLNGWFYVFTGSQASEDRVIQRWLDADREEPTRDFDGHDFTSWAYDLFRPDEPYSARGPHPTGSGLQRYVFVSQLTRQERSYLELQAYLFALNALDPQMFGLRGFVTEGGDGVPVRWSLALRHELTSFGFVVEADALVRREQLRIAAAARVYANAVSAFPGLEVHLVRYPLLPWLEGSGRVAVWLQPRGQRFRASEAEAGALLCARFDAVAGPWLGVFLELEAKSAGWVAANPWLDPCSAARAGVVVTPGRR